MSDYDNIQFPKRDEAWHLEYYRISQLFVEGGKPLGHGDNTVGVRVPLLAKAGGAGCVRCAPERPRHARLPAVSL